jgi:hypothetical protein
MESPDAHELPELDEWLEHIDTVVLGREEGPDVDPPVEDQPSREQP